jgi:hypothetical protein
VIIKTVVIALFNSNRSQNFGSAMSTSNKEKKFTKVVVLTLRVNTYNTMAQIPYIILPKFAFTK